MWKFFDLTTGLAYARYQVSSVVLQIHDVSLCCEIRQSPLMEVKDNQDRSGYLVLAHDRSASCALVPLHLHRAGNEVMLFLEHREKDANSS